MVKESTLQILVSKHSVKRELATCAKNSTQEPSWQTCRISERGRTHKRARCLSNDTKHFMEEKLPTSNAKPGKVKVEWGPFVNSIRQDKQNDNIKGQLEESPMMTESKNCKRKSLTTTFFQNLLQNEHENEVLRFLNKLASFTSIVLAEYILLTIENSPM